MGHYASEMEGPYTGPTNAEQAEEKVADLQGRWDQGLRLFKTAHGGRSTWTCPQCLVKIEFLLMEGHDEWHAKLYEWIDYRARVIGS